MKLRKLLIAVISIIFVYQANAQYDSEAKKVLDAMSGKYKKIPSFEASFTQELTNKSAKINEKVSGKIKVKGDKYALEVAGQNILNDGKIVTSYNAEINEVSISNYEKDESEITLSNVFDIYQKGFKYILLSTLNNGVKVVELNPEDRNKPYHKIRMYISSKNELKSFMIFEKSGNQYTYTVNSFKKATISDSYFSFNKSKFPDAEVLDFR